MKQDTMPGGLITPSVNSGVAGWESDHVDGIDQWQSKIGDCYFSLSLDTYSRNDQFDGDIERAVLGRLQVSRMKSTPAIYRRERHHFLNDPEKSFLVTIPHRSGVRFEQMGREAVCSNEQFILESSHSPYVFEYDLSNSMTVIKVPDSLLRERVKAPEDYCAMLFSRRNGSGALFVNFVQSLINQAPSMNQETLARFSEQAVDLLATVLDTANPNRLEFSSAIRRAHLERLSLYISMNFRDPELSPQSVADACGISLRYLHLLFASTTWTFCTWLREYRLVDCYNALLSQCNAEESIATICYHRGFSDQATFCRAFKSRFEMTPGEVRENASILTVIRDPRYDLMTG